MTRFSSELVLGNFVFWVIGLIFFNYSETLLSSLKLFAGKHRDKSVSIPNNYSFLDFCFFVTHVLRK